MELDETKRPLFTRGLFYSFPNMRSVSRLEEGRVRSEIELRSSRGRMNAEDTDTEVETFSPEDPGPGNREGVDDGLLPKVPSLPMPPFPFPRRPSEPPLMVPESVPDINAYQHKKTVAQGMMDIALLSANANQLRYVLEIGRTHPYYYQSIALISISIILQFLVGICLIWNSRYNVTCESGIKKAERINNWLIFGIFTITVANVFVSAFGISFEFPASPNIPRPSAPQA